MRLLNVWKEIKKGVGGWGGGSVPASALGLQGVETAFPVPGITGEIGRSKQLVWRKSGPVSAPHLEVHQIHPGSIFQTLTKIGKTFPVKYSHFPEKEGEGNMSDAKPSHAYWNGIGKIFKEKEAMELVLSELQRHPVVAPQTRF